jgi:hypothetical protein
MEPTTFVGRAPEQVTEFLAEEVEPVLARCCKAPPPLPHPSCCRYSGKLEGSVSLAV